MNESMKYLTPKMPITEIERQRAELIGISETIASLESRIKKLEGGQAK